MPTDFRSSGTLLQASAPPRPPGAPAEPVPAATAGLQAGPSGWRAGVWGVVPPRGKHNIGAGMRIGQIVLDVTPLRESRDFRWLYGGRLVWNAGEVVAITAANWQVYALTHSPLAVGLLSLTSSVGMLASVLAGGMLADRYDRRTLLLATGRRRRCWPPRSWPTPCSGTRRCGRSS